jgi:hypothetical protein
MYGTKEIQLNTVRGLFADSKSCVKNYRGFNFDLLAALWPCVVYKALQCTSSQMQLRETNSGRELVAPCRACRSLCTLTSAFS